MNTIIKVLLSLILITNLAYAEAPKAKKYDSGAFPAIAKQDNVIVEVHRSGILSKLWYRVGVLENNTIEWGNSYHFSYGDSPSIAIFNNTVVAVHQQYPEDLYYHVGILDIKNKRISWGDSYPYSSGLRPKISMNKDFLIETHHENEYEYTYHYVYNTEIKAIQERVTTRIFSHTHYKTGVIDSVKKTISWIYSNEYDKGVTPAISIQDQQVVEIHPKKGTLWLNLGTIHLDGSIEWQNNFFLGRGFNPSISLHGDDLIEMHENNGQLYYRIGKLNPENNSISLSTVREYNGGVNPSVILDKLDVMEVHSSSFFNSLYQSIGQLDKEEQTIRWETP